MSSDIFDIVAAENDPLTVFSLQDEATQDRIRDSLRLSATLDVPPSQVYADYDIYKEEVNRRNLSPIEKVWPNFKAGVGDVITATGTVLKLMGEEDAGGDLIEYGNRLSMSYIPMAEEREFSWFNMLNTDYLATHLTRSVPFTLSLIPLGLVGFYGGEAVATRLALGAFGRTVLRGIGATALSRPIESAFEAAQTYQDALTKGMSDDEARQAAEFTFKANLALAATDVSEIATAFMPIKLPAKVAGNVLLKRAAAALPVKLLGVAGMEAGEEAIQEAIQRKALGEDIKLDPQMTEAMALGAVFGLGLGGAGSIYTVLTGRVKKQMSQQQRDALEDRVDELQADGMDEQQATIKALDEFTETEEGQQLVETVMQDIVDTVEGKKEPAKIEEPTVAEITKEQPVEERATAKEPWQMTRPEETFKQELETVRKLAETEPAFQPFPHGLGGGFKNIEIAKAIEKAQKNKKLNEREKRIYLAALEIANEKLTEQIANTPDIDIEDYIDNALTRMMQEHYSKADQEKFIVSQIKKAVEKAGGGKQIITDEAVLLRMRLRAEARGAKLAEAETRKLMQKQHKLHMKMLKAARIEVAKFIRENLPQSKRGRFLSAVANEMNLVKQKSIIETVNKIAETVTKNKIIKEIKRLAHPPKTVELGYRKRIKALLEDVSLDKFTQKTIDKATELKKFIEANPNINIPDYHLKKLAAVTKKPLTGLTTQELLTLKEELVRLTALGKLKAKLLKYAGEAKIQRERAKLLASTKNIDPKVPTGTDDISRQRKLFKESALWYYLQTLTPLRVADMFDGFKNFTGEHARWMKDIANRETSALYTAKTDEVSAYSEMLKSGVKSVSEDRQIAMAINIYHQMGAYDQVKTLLEKHGMKEIPEITVKEQEIINIMRRYLNANVEDIAALAEERRNEPFVKVENYFPLKYENDPHNVEIDNLVKQTRRFNKHSVKQDFVYERVKGVKLIPRTDIFSVFSEALNEQQYFLKVQPMLDDIKTIVQSKEFLEKAGDFVTRWWLKQIDIMARRGWSAQGKANPALRQIRINLSRAVLGYKLSSVLMQPFAIFDAMAYMQAKYGTGAAMKILGEFTKAWVNPRLAEQYANVTPVLAVRETGEPVMAELEAAADRLGSPKGIVNVYLRNSMRLLQKADLITAAGVRKGILKVLEERGIPNAETEADIITNLVSASAEVAYRPQILAEGDFAKLWFAFQNFFLNRWGIIAHDIIGSAVKGEMQSKLTSAFALAVFVTGGMLEDWAREKLFEFTTGKEIPDRNPLLEGFMSIPSNIPYFGQFFYAMMTGLDADPPAVRVLGNIFKGGRKLIAGKKPETKGKGALNILESTAIFFPGIPGTAQFADFIEGTIFRPVKKSDSNVKFKKVEI